MVLILGGNDMDKERLKSLKRLMQTLPETEAQRVAKALEKGEKTGYAKITD